MRALLTTGDPDRPISMHDVDDPAPGPSDVVVRVEATSLNRGECRRAAASDAGDVLGWDVVGTVEHAPADRPDLPVGARVVGLADADGWAELVAVPAVDVAVVPDDVPSTEAATLPVAGMTAYHALARGGLLLGREVAVTGATGGVGRFALQLARLAGARTTAIVSGPDRTDGLVDVDAVEVGLDGDDRRFDLILESVGGALLASAIRRVSAGGAIVTYGSSSGDPACFDVRDLYRQNATTVQGFFLFAELAAVGGGGATLQRLLALLSAGHIDPGVSTVADWTDAATVVRELLDRRIVGKAVLTLS